MSCLGYLIKKIHTFNPFSLYDFTTYKPQTQTLKNNKGLLFFEYHSNKKKYTRVKAKQKKKRR